VSSLLAPATGRLLSHFGIIVFPGVLAVAATTPRAGWKAFYVQTLH
jgi:hypothetical protein